MPLFYGCSCFNTTNIDPLLSGYSLSLSPLKMSKWTNIIKRYYSLWHLFISDVIIRQVLSRDLLEKRAAEVPKKNYSMALHWSSKICICLSNMQCLVYLNGNACTVYTQCGTDGNICKHVIWTCSHQCWFVWLGFISIPACPGPKKMWFGFGKILSLFQVNRIISNENNSQSDKYIPRNASGEQSLRVCLCVCGYE